MTNPIPFDNSYAQLPDRFFTGQHPTPVVKPGLIRVNQALAEQLDIDVDWLTSTAGLEVLAGNAVPAGAEPIATVYAGHQFGSWNPQLGDGRAVLLGEVVDTQGARFDIQLKGSGPTAYSRGGDGRAPLGPVLREYIVSEAMFALGVPTTRSLAAVTTGEPVFRETALPGGVLTRVASSHIRIGTFEFFAVKKDIEALRMLADHVINRHYPTAANAANPYLALLESVISRIATLVSQWQQVGFIHGVLNTDNMLLSGETVDYGPCAFMDSFDPTKVYSAIDRGSRYAYQKQPEIAHWNLMVLAQSLLPLIDADQAQAVTLAKAALDQFPSAFHAHHRQGMSAKLGLTTATQTDEQLVRELLELMQNESLDYTLTFRHLSDPTSHKLLPVRLMPWIEDWLARAATETDGKPDYALMRSVNPMCIPRNHLIEAVIKAAIEDNDFGPFDALTEALQTPYVERPLENPLTQPPRPDQIVQNTFCGT